MQLQKLSEHLALEKTVNQLGEKNQDAIRYAYGLIVETVRRKNLIDSFINSVIAPKKIDEFNLGVQSFLRLYVYQTRVARNWEKINLQEAQHIASLGRAILGWQTLREVEQYLGFLLTQRLTTVLEAASDEERVSLETFHPLWFVKYCFTLMGRNEAVAFLQGSMNPPPSYVRLNTLVATEEEILQRLDVEGVKVEKVVPLKFAYKVLETKQSMNMLPSYREGLFYVQDKASCFATEAADPKPDTTVYDVCSAPGAKTTYIAQLMQNEGVVYSLDFSRRRTQTWKREVTRMKTQIAEPIIADACVQFPLASEADLVVLDPPCSGTGIFAKQPSAKWRITAKSLGKMAEIQWRMINSSAEKVRSGGVLTYSTCSITVEENEQIIDRFLKEHSEFRLMEIEPKIGLPGLQGLTECRRLYPNIHQCNGFFIAKLRRH